MNEPLLIQAGETTRWRSPHTAFFYIDENGYTKYPKASEWTLTYYAKSASAQFSIAATADGDDYLVTIPTGTSAAYAAGSYTWMAYISKGSGPTLERYLVASGSVDVKPSFANANIYDNRSYAKKMLDAVEAALLGRADADVMEWQINGMAIKKMAPADLIVWRDRFAADYEMEQRAERIRKGLGHKGRVLLRFK